ncbi:MAG TPA: glycosyltransferase family 39 protein [Pyrinomonadaceae bacterium]|nr:glycosyltransferase family 39 protein [Pyrinomonadaceae bacterium]
MKPPQPSRAEIVLLTACLLVVVSYFYDVGRNPVGFFVDEASIAYNAHAIAQHGADEYGHTFPLYFQAFGEYKSPVYIYVLAGVFRLTGPSVVVARFVSAAVGVLAALLIALLGFRLSGKRVVGLLLFLFATLTPWLFEISRLVFEVALLPALLVAFLLVLQRAGKRERWSWPIIAALGVLLGLIVYTYSVGRLLAPLFALGLVLFAGRGRWRSVVLTWIVFGLMLAPLAVFSVRHPGALGERFKHVTFIKPEFTRSQIVIGFGKNYAKNFSPRSWLISGDPEPRHHLPVMGSLLVGAVALALLGLIVVLLHYRRDPWWWYILFGLLASPLPASLTLDHFHTLRLIALPIFLLVLTVPALEVLIERAGPLPAVRRAVLASLLVITLFQGAVFHWRFHRAPPRDDAFDSYYPALLHDALAQSERPIYLYEKTSAAYVYAYWYATQWGVNISNFQRVPPDQKPPSGAVVIGHELPCSDCQIINQRGQFQVYRVK